MPSSPPFLAAVMLLTGALAAEEPAGPPLSVAAGFTIERVAAAPLVDRPIAMAMDDTGALYVTDSSGKSPHGQEVLKDTGNRVLRLVSSHGDGRYDQCTVFADGLTFPEGCLWLAGSLYVGTTPNIVKLTDTDGDGVADQREIWYDGKTLTGCANDLHGPYLGIDGTISWCKGAFAQQDHTVNGKPWSSRAAHIFRQHPDGSGFEPVMTGGMDNPVDTVQTSTGQRFFTTTFFQNPANGRRDGLVHAVYGGVWGKDHQVLDGHRRTGELMPVLTHLGAAAPCGLTAYASRVFGDDWFDNLIACQFNLHKLSRHVLVEQGSTFTTKDSDLVWSTSFDFHPTDVIEDADGSLLIANTGAWYKICCPTSQLAKPDVLGGIYRLRRTGAPVVADPRGALLDWKNPSAHDLALRLGDPRPAVRQRAAQVMGGMGEAAVATLDETVAGTASTDIRRGALWTLARIPGDAARAANRRALTAADAGLREVAVQVAALWSDRPAAPALRTLLTDPAPRVRRGAAEALGRCGEPGSANLTALLSAIDNPSERMMEHAFIYALEAQLAGATEQDIQTLWSSLPDQAQPGVPARWRALLIAVDQAQPKLLPPERVVPLLSHADPLLRDAAIWIVAHRPDWDEALIGHLHRQLADPALAAGQRASIQALLTSLASAPGIRRLLAEAPLDATLPTAGRTTVLAAMAEVSVKKAPDEWAASLAVVLATADPTLVQAAVLAARRLPFSADQGKALAAALAVVAADASRNDALRLEALSAIPGGLTAVAPPLFDLLCANLPPTSPVAARAAAVQTLVQATLAREQKLALLRSLQGCGPMEFVRLLPLYAGETDEELGLALVAALRAAPAAASLRAEQLKPVLEKAPQRVRDEATAWLATLNQDAQKQAAYLDELMPGLAAGEARRGQELFNSPRVGCTTCHTIGYVGGRIGPDLTSVGGGRSERDLLESIVFPSASFVRSYEPMQVLMKDGQSWIGNIKNEGADFIVLNLITGNELRLGRGDIAEIKPGTVSLMPAGFDRLLSRQELADLIAFLKSRRG